MRWIAIFRRDFYFTIFLNGPEENEGRELVLNIIPKTKQVKLDAVSIILYTKNIYIKQKRWLVERKLYVLDGFKIK